MASCPMPNHRDSEPSVAITQDAGTGAVLMYCHGCGVGGSDIARALGVKISDLFGDPGHPAAIPQAVVVSEASAEDRLELKDYVSQTYDKLDLAKDYLLTRFSLSVEQGRQLHLGVDPGDHTINRPFGFSQFNTGTPHLIIPFMNPSAEMVGMQGRRLTAGEPRWRSNSGSGWSKLGCFGWDLDGPVIITEGPSDALSVVGLARLPALAVRGASLTGDTVFSQIRDWLKERPVLVIGDQGEAGVKFARHISEGAGIPSWTLPDDADDLCDFLNAGGSLLEALPLAVQAPDQIELTVRQAFDAYVGETYFQASPGRYLKVAHSELVSLDDAGVKSMLSQMRSWRAMVGRRELGHVPDEVVNCVSASSWESHLPNLTRTTRVPFMLANGTVVDTPGWHRESGVYLLPHRDPVHIREVPDIISLDTLTEARHIFDTMSSSYDEASKANLAAMILTPPLRDFLAHDPMVPVFVSNPLDLRAACRFTSLSTTQNSLTLSTKLLEKPEYLLFTSSIDSILLEQGKHVLWMSTLDSMALFEDELRRRCVVIRPARYSLVEHGELLWASFAVARYWLQVGAPESGVKLEGYGAWTTTIGGIVEHILQYANFLGNL